MACTTIGFDRVEVIDKARHWLHNTTNVAMHKSSAEAEDQNSENMRYIAQERAIFRNIGHKVIILFPQSFEGPRD
jgi:hypothetical protein